MTDTHDLAAHPIVDAMIRGALELERSERGVVPHRLPAWARAQVTDAQLTMVEVQPSGVRLSLRTEATVIELDAMATRINFLGAPPRPIGVFDLAVDGTLAAQASLEEANQVTIDMTTGAVDARSSDVGTVCFRDLPNGRKHIEIWLPHNEKVELVALRANAPVAAAATGHRPVWLHHGSSISHGSNASHPMGAWPMVAAGLGQVELVNLGFGGSALLDPFTARTMRDIPADLISVKLGINLVNTDLMRMRAFVPAVHGFLDMIRDGHPDVPLVVVSPIYCPIHEHTPGPGALDMAALARGEVRFIATGNPADSATGRLTLTVIREALADIVRQRAMHDAHLHYIDGLELYGASDCAELPLPDDLHPDAVAHQRIGERFAARVFGGRLPA